MSTSFNSSFVSPGGQTFKSRTAGKTGITNQAIIVLSVNGENLISETVPENKIWDIAASISIVEKDV